MGGRLVADPVIKAVAFTGSLAGGRALFDIAVSRPDPIPFYGELGSLNPVVISPKAARARGESLARGLVQSFTLGGGQFCTKPGLVFVPAGSGFEQHVAGVVTGSSGQPLLTERIGQAFSERVDEMARVPGVTTVIGNVEQSSATDPATPVVLSTTVATALAHADVLLEECFGPTTVVIGYSSLAELVECLQAVEGSLTATCTLNPTKTFTRCSRFFAARRAGCCSTAGRRGSPWRGHSITGVRGRRPRRCTPPLGLLPSGASFVRSPSKTLLRCCFRLSCGKAIRSASPAASTAPCDCRLRRAEGVAPFTTARGAPARGGRAAARTPARPRTR